MYKYSLVRLLLLPCPAPYRSLPHYTTYSNQINPRSSFTSSKMTSETQTAESMNPNLFPPRTPFTPAQISAGIQAALEVQRRAVTFGKRPFAGVLVGPDNETVLLTHQSLDQVNHAESSLARLAYTHYSKEFLWTCTLFSTWEPCGMCTATIYVGSPCFKHNRLALSPSLPFILCPLSHY